MSHQRDVKELIIKRGLNPHWDKASCRSVNIAEATEVLNDLAKFPGIMIEGAKGSLNLNQISLGLTSRVKKHLNIVQQQTMNTMQYYQNIQTTLITG